MVTVAMAIAIVIAVGAALVAHAGSTGGQVGDRSEVGSVTGNWALEAISRGSAEDINVPREFDAGVSFDADGETVDISDGHSSYGCRYIRAGAVFTLTDCVVAPNVPGETTALDQAVVKAHEDAFVTSVQMTAVSTAIGKLSLQIRDIVFHYAKDA
jgi:hypothetical protein